MQDFAIDYFIVGGSDSSPKLSDRLSDCSYALQDFAIVGGPWLPSATAFFNVFLMASLKVIIHTQCSVTVIKPVYWVPFVAPILIAVRKATRRD